MTDPALSGGGYAQAQLSHALGLAPWLSEQRAAQVFAMANNAGGRVDVHDALCIRYRSSATARLSGASFPLRRQALRRQGAAPSPATGPGDRLRRQLIIDLERDFLWHYHDAGLDTKVDLPPHAGRYECEGPPSTLVDLAIGEDRPNRSPAEPAPAPSRSSMPPTAAWPPARSRSVHDRATAG